MQQTASEDVAAIWERVREQLEASVPASAYKLWLEPLRAVSIGHAKLYLSAPSEIRAWVERRYSARIAAVVRELAPAVRAVGFVDAVEEAPNAGDVGAPQPGFDHFVIGESNRFAHAAALAVAEMPGEAYNPLFLHGPPGVGKSHLLAAVAEYLRSRHPGMSVRITTAERFTSEFVAAVTSGRGQRFKDDYRDVDALLIDDIQFLEEFFHTFNALHQSGRQIVLSSDRPPRELARIAERLRDRFEWGLCAPISAPDPTTRLAVLRRLATETEPSFVEAADDVVLREIATQCSNLRQLEGALTRVVAFSSVMDAAPNPALVRDLLGSRPPVASDPAPDRPTLEAIQDATCEVFRVSRLELLSKARTPKLVRARQLAMYVARDRLSLSLTALAQGFHRDRATVLYSLRAVERDLSPGSEVHTALERVVEKLVPARGESGQPKPSATTYPTGRGAIPPDPSSIMSRTHGGPR